MLKIDISRSAAKFIQKLPPKHFKQVVGTLFHLRKTPTPQDSEQLSGFPQYRRTEIGEYRIIYRFDQDTLFVAVVGKRNDDAVLYESLGNSLFLK
ncbi:Genome sequencing data, contig C322 [Desulfamplus magnetovallimortis]|uniref:Genome sequencing data, contig C322 n=1 Tax=Desulfamplus magnetovallimortis TaxID=1246637 RepID=A0A1W1H8L7_9BACT|nr:type II toxin-antitoxin system RelE/ParE family toxin [Desulfamplus magnetovallimortis]SLM28827.1 Genome sequencing data, contig C322 [Desulfamplus magnetovallimortis]